MALITWRDKFFTSALYFVGFVISFPFKVGAIAVWILIFFWILQGNFKEKIKRLVKPAYIIWILYFVLFALSFLYSENKVEALKDLEKKLAFIIFPIVVGSGTCISRKNLENLFFCFVAGLTITAFYCIGAACRNYYITHDKDYFFYHTLVRDFDSNAVYISFYVLLGLFLLLFFKWNRFFKSSYRGWKWIFTLVLFTFFLLLSCRMLIVTFFILLFVLGGRTIFAMGRSYPLRKILISIIAISALCIVAFTNNPVRSRYKDLHTNNIGIIFQKKYSDKDFKLDHLTFRPFIWRVCIENIIENRLWWKGCGNGDIKDLQNKKFKALGVPGFKKEDGFQSPLYDIAIHNMYLQTLMMIGIPGLICLLVIVILPFFYLKYFNNKFVFFVFFISAMLFMCQESVFQTQAGIIYYTFFSIVFWNYYYSNKNSNIISATVS